MNHGNGIEASASDGFCGTSYAAKLLGVSVGTVQGLVEKNELQAWKTQGGHRRISLTSIYDYQRRYNLHATPFGPEQQRLRVLVVDDDPPTREMLQSHFQQWKGPIDVSFYASPLDAMLDMFSLQPHVLITDLNMPVIDGFEFLRAVGNHSLFRKIAVLVITGLTAEQIHSRGGLPDGVQILRKPIDLDWLKGFFDAMLSMRQMTRRSLDASRPSDNAAV